MSARHKDLLNAFTRRAIALGVQGESGTSAAAQDYALRRWGASAPEIKAVTVGGTTSDPDYAALANADAVAFVEAVSEVAVTGRLPLRAVPLHVRIAFTTEGATGHWVGEGKAKPVEQISYDDETMQAKKISAIAVVTDELLRVGTDEAEASIRNDLVRAAVAALDTKFLSDDSVSEDAPAGILEGVTPAVATGAVDSDLRQLVADFDGDLSRAWFVARPEIFAQLSGPAYPTVGLRGGTLIGAPAIATRHAPADTLILVDPARIAYATDGASVHVSKRGTVAMNTAPMGDINADDSPPTVTGLGGTGENVDMVSLWQQNLTGFLVELRANWRVLPGAVAALDTAEWDSGESPA